MRAGTPLYFINEANKTIKNDQFLGISLTKPERCFVCLIFLIYLPIALDLQASTFCPRSFQESHDLQKFPDHQGFEDYQNRHVK